MPGITFEMDPNVAAIGADYTSLVWLPPQGKPGEWSPYLDATKEGALGIHRFDFQLGDAADSTGRAARSPR